MKEKWSGRLSRELPGQRVKVSDTGAENKSYYKYYLEDFRDISPAKKETIRKAVFKKGEGLEITDRARLCEEKAFPAQDGYYPLKGGGVVSGANIKTPDLDRDMCAWWTDWHGLENLRYAIWDPQDHYAIDVIENKERLLNEKIPYGERVWGTRHRIWESMDQEKPGKVEMIFLCPWECGYDRQHCRTVK